MEPEVSSSRVRKFFGFTLEKSVLFSILFVADSLLIIFTVISTYGGVFFSSTFTNIVIYVNIFPLYFASYASRSIILSFILLVAYLIYLYVITCLLAYLHDRFFKGKRERKISVLVALCITLAIAAIIWPPLAPRNSATAPYLQVMDTYCIKGNEAVILLRNVGTQNANLAPGGDVDVIDVVSGQDPGGEWYDINDPNGTLPLTRMEPGQVTRYNVSCTGYCQFRFLTEGRTSLASVQC